MVTKSTRMRSSKPASAPRKPRTDFPLFVHQSDRWAKKVRGKLHYFGKASADPRGEAALALWLEQKDELLAGRKPRPSGDGVRLEDACNAFLAVKDSLVTSGELTLRSWLDYRATARRLVAAFGRSRRLDDLRPEDFAAFRAELGKTLGLVSVGNVVQHVRTMFKWFYESELIDRPVRTGPDFKRPSKKARRRARIASGPKMFEAAEIRAMIEAAGVPLKAMILLAINCGLGNQDLSTMTIDSVDLEGGWHRHGRPKTGVERKAALWPKTIEAIRAALAVRPKPKQEADQNLLFVTKYGARFVRPPAADGKQGWTDGIAQEFRKLAKQIGIDRPGVAFYTFRRTFRTVADETGDQAAVNSIMGHADGDNDMAAVYRQRIADFRFLGVSEYVRRWLFESPSVATAPEA